MYIYIVERDNKAYTGVRDRPVIQPGGSDVEETVSVCTLAESSILLHLSARHGEGVSKSLSENMPDFDAPAF